MVSPVLVIFLILIKLTKFVGAGGPIMHSLLTQLGADVIGLNLEPTGKPI